LKNSDIKLHGKSFFPESYKIDFSSDKFSEDENSIFKKVVEDLEDEFL
jgi:hypothetical protein